MEKFVFSSILAAAAVIITAFTLQNPDKETNKKLPPCKKIYQMCPSGIIYYKCSRSGGGEASPDCYDVTNGPNNNGCNITLRPC